MVFEFSDIIMMSVFLFIVIFVSMFFILYIRQARQNEILQKEMLNVILHSKFNDRRSEMEEILLEIGRKFQKTGDDFSDVYRLPLRVQNLSENQNNNFLESLGINLNASIKKEKQIFFLTPFSDVEKQTFSTVRNILMESGFQVFRGDETKRTDILPHVVRSMIESELIIANLNGRNPNVMYELGIAHMLNKPVILMAEMGENLDSIPIDLRAKNIVLYKNFDDLRERILKATLQVI